MKKISNSEWVGWGIVTILILPHLILLTSIAFDQSDQNVIGWTKDIMSIVSDIATTAGVILAGIAYKSWKKPIHYDFKWKEDQRLRKEIDKIHEILIKIKESLIEEAYSSFLAEFGEEEQNVDIIELRRKTLHLAKHCREKFSTSIIDFSYTKPLNMKPETKEIIDIIPENINRFITLIESEESSLNLCKEADYVIKILEDIDKTLIQID